MKWRYRMPLAVANDRGRSLRRVRAFSTNEAEIVSNRSIARRLLNVREAAQFLALEVDTVYKKSRLREVPCVKVGRSLRFDVKALEQYIEQHSIQTID
jgi:excisionase family DNA binding protein